MDDHVDSDHVDNLGLKSWTHFEIMQDGQSFGRDGIFLGRKRVSFSKSIGHSGIDICSYGNSVYLPETTKTVEVFGFHPRKRHVRKREARNRTNILGQLHFTYDHDIYHLLSTACICGWWLRRAVARCMYADRYVTSNHRLQAEYA